MKLLRLSLFLLLCAFAEKLLAQVTVSGANAGSNGSYTNLSGAAGAFFGINGFAQTGNNIMITITGNVTEPNSSNVALIGGAWTTISIKPSGGSWTITGAPAANGMIIFNGADNVTIDGSISGVVSLTIANTSSSASAMAIKLYNDATNNVIKYCNLQGRNASTQTASDGGIVTIAGTSGSTGNDNNYIQNCDFGPDAATLPFILIKGYGSGNANDLCQITNCALHDWIDLTAGNNTCAVYIASTFVSTWTISGNKFYQSSTRDIVAGGANDFYGLRIEGGGGYTVSNNVFGYNTSAGTGYLTFTNNIAGSHTSIDLYPISLNLNTTTSTISGNTIANIDFTTARSTNTGTTYSFVGIWLKGGKANITNNIIGSTSGTGSILFKQNLESGGTSPFLPVVGILISGSSANTISGNTIGGISISYTGSTGSVGAQGGNPFVAIYSNNTNSSFISGNTIGNSTANNITSVNTISGANIVGIKLTSAAGTTNTISSNTIQNLTCSGANAGISSNASVIGIQNTSFSGPSDAITGNTISNLTNTATSGSPATDVRGMYVTGGSGGLATALVVQQNWVHSLSVSSSSSTAQVSGITIFTGGNSATLVNNMISLGSGISNGNLFYGINYVSSTVTGYFNTVRIQGMPTSGSGNSHAFYCATTNALVLKNNIFINERSNSGTSTGTHYAIRFNSTPSTYTGTANDLFTSGTGGVLGYVGAANKTSLALWSAATTPVNQDNPAGSPPSLSMSFTFVSTIDLHIVANACDISTLNNAGTPIAGFTTDYDATSRSGTTPDIGADEVSNAIAWAGATSTDWNVSTNWSPQIVPTIYYDVTIPVVTTNYPVISSTTATCHSLTVIALASLTMNSASKLTIDATCSNATFTNAGTFTANSNTEVIFTKTLNSYTATIVPIAATQFENVTLNIGVGMGGSGTTVNGILQLKSGSYVFNSSAPTYSTNSTLQYNTNGSYTANAEWYDNTFSGSGWPQHVDIAGTGTKLVFNTAYPREMRGNLTIGSSDTLALSSTLGGDLYIKGNWTRAAIGVFIPVGRLVKFNGTANQTITVTGGGIETFHYVEVNKSAGDLYLSNTAGNLTSMKITMYNYSGSVYTYLTMSGGNINLNGQTLFWAAPTAMTSGQTASYWNATGGIRSVTGTGTVSVTGTLYATSFLVTSTSSGTLLFDQNVTLKDATGEINFGTGNLTTIKGVFQVDNGGAAVGNAAHYDTGSILRFTGGNDYQVGLNDITWANGVSGDIGIPYHLEITTAASSTDLIIQAANVADHLIRGNLTITGSTLQLSTGATGDLYINGDWTRTNGSFSPNSKTVIFSGASLQTISLNAGYETYYGLKINNASGIALSGATSSVSVSNLLTLTNGLITTGSNEVSVTNDATGSISYPASNSSAASWVNGNLRRKITTGVYAFPVGTSTLTNGDGYELALFDFATNSNVDNLLGRFTADATTTADETFSLTVNGTVIVDRLNAGYWNFKPYDAALALVASPSCTYNVALNERGHSNSAASPFYYAVIKRVDSADPTGAVWNQQCGTHVNATQSESGGTAYAERSDYSCNSFSDFSIGVGTFILPVELTTFTVSLIGENSLLEWNTQSEWNSNYFAIERSLDGIQFEEIGITNAAGSSTVPNNYFYTDYEVTELGVTKIYYRLRMVNLDQTFTYSPVRWVELQEQDVAASIFVFPNPAHDNTSISLYAASEQSALLQLVDVSGKVFFEMTPDLKKGINFIEVDHLDKISAGLYFIHVICGRDFYSTKLVKE
ncbi:MAG: T9SS type A sorting domain-containing protein [Chitinophagaceae bacterium]|nr:T9SS type A sorting domain-containing protein [Chitinophagaceae bacterium]